VFIFGNFFIEIREEIVVKTYNKELFVFSYSDVQASRGAIIMETANRSYKVNVSVVDVGPKPISCVNKHWKRDADVLTACATQLCSVSLPKS
jgi:hypothetical protein